VGSESIKHDPHSSDNSQGPVPPLGSAVLDFAGVVTSWRRFIVWFVISVTVLTTVIALLSPKWYKATVSVFPAEQADLFSGLDGVSSLMKSIGGGGSKRLTALGAPTELDRYVAILKSENALMKVADKFNLTSVYDITSFPRENTMKTLLSNVDIVQGDEGTLEVSVYDRDPQRAAAMANYFLDVLNGINSQMRSQDAKGNREFIEQRYNTNLADLKNAEEALKTFQLKYGVIAMPAQTEASIKAGAEISAQLATKEIQLNILKRTLTPSHPSITQAQIEVDEIHKMLKQLDSGSGSPPDEMKILVPFRQTPQLAVDYIRLYRNVEIQNKILQLLTPLYEQSKVEEQRNTPSVVVLDKASVPERKSKPKVSLFALLALVISLVVALVIAFFMTWLRRLESINPERMRTIRDAARMDWFGLRWWKK
jgi:tyrosine-protein kinase Etk/Wzc